MRNWGFTVICLLLVAFTTTAKNDSKFLILETVTEDTATDGSAHSSTVVNYSYDDEGRAVARTTEWDFDGDGIRDHWSTSTITYNSQNQRIRAVNDSYDRGVLQARSIITDEYDARGNRTLSFIEADSNADGTVDHIARTTYRYNERDLLLGWIIETDRGADGTWDDIETVTQEYDARDYLISSIRETDNGRDGQIETRRTLRFTVDSQGNRTEAVHEIDHSADGIVEFRDRTVYAYDRGKLISSTTESDYDFGDGLVEHSISWSTYSYDRHGNLVRTVQEYDYYADGTIDGVRTSTQTWTRR